MFICRDVQVLKFGIHSLLLSAVAQKVKKRWSNPTVGDLFPSMVNVFSFSVLVWTHFYDQANAHWILENVAVHFTFQKSVLLSQLDSR